jgi:orotidine-5'-phosphate decarboxylase
LTTSTRKVRADVQHFSDRLAESVIARESVVCAGIDPSIDRLPDAIRSRHAVEVADLGEETACAGALREFGCGIVAAVADVAACVKPNAAFFEQYGAPGWQALADVVRCARDHDLPVIVDAKRGDIASTGEAYARALFGGAPGLAGAAPGLGADAATVSPYLGEDSLTPFTDACAQGRGVFVLTRTSNPGAALLQERAIDGRALFLHVADLVARLGAGHVGGRGYSDVGAVAGATAPASLQAVRAVLPRSFLLIPGYGAQGGGADALVGLAVGDGAGLVVNASRTILYAYRERGGDFQTAAAQAAREMRDDLRRVL